jgi:hypothetical protein
LYISVDQLIRISSTKQVSGSKRGAVLFVNAWIAKGKEGNKEGQRKGG